MVDLHSILASHHKKPEGHDPEGNSGIKRIGPEFSEIPDLFFDEILVNYKLSRLEVSVLMYLYRQVWCRPNLHRMYGLTQIQSYTDIANAQKSSMDEVYQVLRKLESYGFIETIRSGQYFVRRFFTEEYDEFYGMTYDNF